MYKLLSIFISLFYIPLMLVSRGCDKHNPHEPVPSVPPDTVIVHFHHDHIVIVIDTLFQVCDTLDVTVQVTLIGDQSAPNIYDYFLNGIYKGTITINDTFSIPTELMFDIVFEGIVFGDVISVRRVSGSRAEVVGIEIIDMRCYGST